METTTSPQKKASHTAIELVMLCILILMAGVLYYIYSSNKAATLKNQNLQTSVPTVEPSSTPIPPTATPTPLPRPLPHGKTPFMISVGQDIKGPRMGAGTIDPIDPSRGGKVQVTLEIGDKVPVQKVVARLKTDNKTTPTVELKLISGTTLSGKWEGEWTIDDSYLYEYFFIIDATSASGTTHVEMALR